MNREELTGRIQKAIGSGDFSAEIEALVDDLKAGNCGLDEVECILSAMEQNPEVDFGVPGPLVHLVERFYKRGYEALLLDSVSRHPTGHTLWMLNRVMNGTKDAPELAKFVEALKEASKNERAEDEARKAALHFLGLHT